MGGFTGIYLKDASQENIDKHNALLKVYGVAKKYRFYSEEDIEKEYDHYLNGEGHYPDHLFPKHMIDNYNDFKRYWSTEALGEVFVPRIGSLTFDCYFGRTSNRAMKAIGRYLATYHNEIKEIGGSFATFMERGLNRKQSEILSKFV